MFDAERSNPLVTEDDISKADNDLHMLRRKYHAEQMILRCIGPGGINCAGMFKPVLTDSGICYALLSQSQNESIKSNSYVRTFNKIFSADQDEIDDNMIFVNLTSSFEVFIIFDSHQSGN